MADEIKIQGLTALNCDLAKRLPIDPENGDEICDDRGNRYRFNGKTSTWIFIGAIHIPSTVTESTDGVITPEIFGKLRHVENIITNGVDFSQFKIFPGTEGYWYYFRSGDKSIKFDVEGEDQLRIEIDSGRFHQIISKRSCKGQFGDKGTTGEDGDMGDSSPKELVFIPSDVDEDKIDFAIFTPTPLDKPISLRLIQCEDFDITNNCGNGETIKIANEEYQSLAKTQTEYFTELIRDFNSSVDNFTIEQLSNLKRFIADKSLGSFADVELSILLSKIRFMAHETICSISTIAEEPDITILIDPKNNVPPTVTVKSEEFEIDEERTFATLKYDVDIGVLSGTVYLKRKTWKELGKWCIKSRQTGPTGPDGEDGLCTLDIKEVSIDPRNIFTLCPIVNVRYDKDKDIIYTLCSDIGTTTCASEAILIAGSDGTTNENAIKSRFAAVIRSIDDCKDVAEYRISLKEDDIPELTFSHWDPQPGCQTSRHYDRHKFDWFIDTESKAKEGQEIPQWYGVVDGEVDCLTADYPNKIITASKPEEQCCTEEFFYCPNIQEAPAECGEEGDITIRVDSTATTTTTTTTTTTAPPSLVSVYKGTVCNTSTEVVYFHMTAQQAESWLSLPGSIKLQGGKCVQISTVTQVAPGEETGGHFGPGYGEAETQYLEYFSDCISCLPVYKGTACDDPNTSYYFTTLQYYKRGSTGLPSATERGTADDNISDRVIEIHCCADATQANAVHKVCVKDAVLVHDAPDGFTDNIAIFGDPATTVHVLAHGYDSCNECGEAIAPYF